jgi:hypothetical protein
MPDITVTVTDAQAKCLDYIATDKDEFLKAFIDYRALEAGNEIIAALVEHCNANDITIATGRDAQITQAFALNVVDTLANVQANRTMPG